MSDANDGLTDLTPEQRRALLAELLKDKARQQSKIVPASDGQRALWLTQQSAPESFAYHVSFSARIRSVVNPEDLKKAAQAVINRHATLRTTYALQGDVVVQEVHHYQDVDFLQVDATGCGEEELYRLVVQADHQPFHLDTGPVIRWRLFTRSVDEHIFLITAHHTAIDAWSLWIVLEDLRQAMQAVAEGKPIHLAPEPAPYTAWSAWQAEMLAGPEGEALREFWKQQLSGDLPVLQLPYDFERPLIPTLAGDSIAFTIDAEQTRRLKGLAQANGVTLYMVMLAAYQVLLHRYTGQEDILVGTPTAGRGEVRYNGTVGYFVNPVTLRGDLSGAPTFREYLARVRETVLAALNHQNLPFLRVVELLHARPEANRSPVFQAMFNLHSLARTHEIAALVSQKDQHAAVDFGGLRLERYFFPQEEGQFELGLETLEAGDLLACTFRYQTDLFKRETVERICGSFQVLVEDILQHPDAPIHALQVLSPDERQKILVDWNQTQAAYPQDAPLHRLFEAQAARTPDAVAVAFEDQVLTYAQLNKRANRLANHLRQLGIGPEQLVGVYLERSLDMMVALLGVLKSGGAYVPMDPIYPPQRIQYMIEDSQMAVIVTQQSLADTLPENTAQLVLVDEDAARIAAQSGEDVPAEGNCANLAYVIFTSGSTGRPKGVQIPHRALTNFLISMQRQPGIQPDDVLVAVTTLSFDIAGLELYLPLISGARVVILSSDITVDGTALAEALDYHQATILQATPATWRLLAETGWQGRSRFKMLCGGEPLPHSLAQQLLKIGSELWNLYGPTETTIWSTVERIQPGEDTISIGRPIANTQIYILDQNQQPVPRGVIGMLYIGGDGLARGYLGRPDLTAEKFLPNPFDGGRIYNTGDLARYLPDGRIEHLGRGDHQVKIRGFRIELGEIEATLGQHPAVQQAVVTVREDTPGDKRLAAYLIPQAEAAPSPRELRGFLKNRLPAYMLPASFTILEAFPTTPNGKINRAALPAPERSSAETQKAFQPPTTPTEQAMAEIWKDMLKIEQINLFDNFFDLGGHSLLAMRTVAKIQETYGQRIDPAYLRFESLGQLAARLDALRQQPA